MFFLILLLMQIHIIFSMEETFITKKNPEAAMQTYSSNTYLLKNDSQKMNYVDFYINLNNLSTPSFNASALIAFFNGAELQNFSCKVDTSTKALTEKIISNQPNAWQNAETTARIIEAQKYPCNIATLFQNPTIINTFKKCLILIPTEYVETEKDFKKFWYTLWKLIIPKEKEQQLTINNYLPVLINDTITKRRMFLNFFSSDHMEIDKICIELSKTQSIMENFIKTIHAEKETISLYNDILLTTQTSFKGLAYVSAILYDLRESYIHLNKRRYIHDHKLMVASAYMDYLNINNQWKRFWESSCIHEQRFAVVGFNIEWNNYLAFLQSHLSTIEEFIL